MLAITNRISTQDYKKPQVVVLGPALDLIRVPSPSTERDLEEIATRMPPQLGNFAARLLRWKALNEKDARGDARLVKLFMLPAILLVCAYAFLGASPFLLKLSGGIIAACAVLYGFFQPGRLYQLHKHAEHDIQNLVIEVCDKWLAHIGKTEDKDALAREIILRAKKERSRIAKYLRDGEARIYRQRMNFHNLANRVASLLRRA